MADLDEKPCKLWRKGLEVHRGCPGEDPLILKSDLGHFSEIKRNKTERRREERAPKRERMVILGFFLSVRERVSPHLVSSVIYIPLNDSNAPHVVSP